MKTLLTLLLFSLAGAATVHGQSAQAPVSTTSPDPSKELILVDASCGQCRLGLPGKGCDLAVRLNGKAYFVEGTSIDSHGDAHAKDGFCQAIRRAEVQGELVDNRFKASYFKLLPGSEKAK